MSSPLRPLIFLLCLLLTSTMFLPRLPWTNATNEKVTVSVYYETMCPYCAEFIVNHLVKLFEQDGGLISIVNLRLIPWGNAFVQSDGSFVCQHGPGECLLNAIEACTINIYPDVERHFGFIYCVERLTLENNLNEWINCFQMSGLVNVPIECYNNGYGNVHIRKPRSISPELGRITKLYLVPPCFVPTSHKLEQNYAAETLQLNPPHRFVPWVVVNGQPLQEDYKNYVSYICKAYQGTQFPNACTSIPARDTVAIQNAESRTLGCHVGESHERRNVTQPTWMKIN